MAVPTGADLKDTAADLQGNHLGTWQGDGVGLVDEGEINTITNPMAVIYPGMTFNNPDEMVLGCIIKNDARAASRKSETAAGSVRGNACRKIWWEPSVVKAALVTCGGLCPGLNSIIREVTNCLWHTYGVKDILGMPAGYNGLSNPARFPAMALNPDNVREIHLKGGSILKAGRGGFEPEQICDTFEKLGINMLFLIGGDGTQSAGNVLYQTARKRNIPVSIIGIPKSIDNDVLFFDKTFGFESAVTAASDVIRDAWVEATSCTLGVGIVKLMGRDAGFVGMEAARASTLADAVLIPEIPFELDDVHEHIEKVLDRKGHCVVIVAEGAGQNYVATGEKDSTGHDKYGDIGTFMRDSVNKHLKPKGGRSFYIDPSYIIRSVPATPTDHLYCSRLANDAVHTAFRGYSGVCVGPIHEVICLVPSRLVAGGKKRVNIKRSAWQSCVQSCHMPATLSGLGQPQ